MPDTEISSSAINAVSSDSKESESVKESTSLGADSKGADVVDESAKEKKEEKGNGLIDNIDISREARNRVKLYVLCDQRVWDDRGTGHVACVQIPDQQGFVIIVRLESATSGADKNVLESKILMDTVYQKQQETLIVWSESDTCDLALSFQEKSGCEEIWAKICEVQGRDPGDADGGYDEMDDGELSEGSSNALSTTGAAGRVVLPPIEIGRLSEVDTVIQNHLATQALREKMANAVESECVLPKLVDVFHMCEDVEHKDGLRTLYSIAKNLFMLNRNSLNETLLSDKYLKDLIGMLEYDPAHEAPRKHREFLYEKATFREVLPIANDELKEKIHQTYRVQYLQDVCLPAPSLFEENLLSVLNSYLFFNRIDIVNMLQKDKRLMKELFDQLRDPETTVSRRRDLAFFLKEFISLSQGLPPNGAQSKDNFFKNLQANDVLGTIEPCIKSPDPDTRITIVDMLALLVEHSPQLVRDYLLRQAKDKSDDEVLLNRLLIHMQTDRDPELTSGSQVSQVLRTLLDPDNMVSMQKSDRSEFLSLFYQRSIFTLVKPMLENVKGGTIKRDDYCTANRQSLVIRLLCFCIEHHSFSMRQHCISNDLLNKVLVLLQSKHHFLALDVTYVKLFSELKIRYEQQRDRENAAKITADERVPSPAAFAKERQEEQWFDGEDDEATECKKEPSEVKKEIKKEVESPRKTGIEPMFPSVLKRKNAFDEDDGAVFSGQVAPLTPVNIITEKKIVIKVGDRSRTPSPLGSPSSLTPPPSQAREDEVSSSQNNSKENSPMSIKSLVDYDESDSDEDESSAPSDSIPSSSTGSPVQNLSAEKGSESTTSTLPTSSGGDLSPCDDDVSSTSGEEESATGGCGLVPRKRPSTGDIDVDSVKRSRASPET
ncbi:Serine/threonine-protein phosphatase 4 regulatory subunit 3 [Trichostrongylus colubriformis]|uniref:Serine/threonine-protein phosphatase 4 regulatory subunit 3 n=1 Tax=Trichostrongylus colubriformis TaxID=6319 RepID=A0AAN8ITC7_TRICO